MALAAARLCTQAQLCPPLTDVFTWAHVRGYYTYHTDPEPLEDKNVVAFKILDYSFLISLPPTLGLAAGVCVCVPVFLRVGQ